MIFAKSHSQRIMEQIFQIPLQSATKDLSMRRYIRNSLKFKESNQMLILGTWQYVCVAMRVRERNNEENNTKMHFKKTVL